MFLAICDCLFKRSEALSGFGHDCPEYTNNEIMCWKVDAVVLIGKGKCTPLVWRLASKCFFFAAPQFYWCITPFSFQTHLNTTSHQHTVLNLK